jgi:aminoglycoside/choline kinase family phosphotransferase
MPEELLDKLRTWVAAQWPGGARGRLQVDPIPADGSPRLFVRFTCHDRSLVGLANPANPAENRAWLWFARHLLAQGLPVPEILAADEEQGYFLMTDLGGESLRQRLLALGEDEPAIAQAMEPVLALLARLQARGAKGLDLGICFDGQRLDPAFLLEREAGYFLREFVAGACGLGRDQWPKGLEVEITELSRLAGEAGPVGLVHRDFQWRNIIYGDKGPGLVDFQGARLGPAQYDLAALLHEAGLGWELKSRLLERYLELRGEMGPFDEQAFKAGWPFVSLSRIMQALGAFGFLSLKRGLPHLYEYAAPHVKLLRELSAQEAFRPFKALKALAAKLPHDFKRPA